MARNQFLFTAATLASKPEWVRRQLAGFFPPSNDSTPATTPPEPTERARRSRKAPAVDRASSGPEPEQALRDASMEPPKGETLYPGRVSVCVVSYRRRLLDPDNLCAKWFLDACRYARLISDDRPQDITFSVAQEKVRTKEEERTEITLTPIP